MWIAVIIIVVLICVCIAIANASEEQNKQSEKLINEQKSQSKALLNEQKSANKKNQLILEQKALDQFRAKFPSSLSENLKEEFPEHSAVFTYGRCQNFIKWYDDRAQPAMEKARETKLDRADRLLGMLFIREFASDFSQEFADAANAEPERFWRTIVLCVEAAAVRAKGAD